MKCYVNWRYPAMLMERGSKYPMIEGPPHTHLIQQYGVECQIINMLG